MTTIRRFVLPSAIILTLAMAMSFAVSEILKTSAVTWESEHVTSVVRREADDGNVVGLFHDPGAAQAGWPEFFSRVTARIDDVVRCRSWGADGVVLWSDDPTLIGSRAADNPDLEAALRGRVVARLVEPEASDTNGGSRALELYRVYIPVMSQPGGRVHGVIELRKIPSRLIGRLGSALAVIWAIGIAGGAALWLAIRPLARSAAAPRREPDDSARTTTHITDEIRERFGFVPPFFDPARDTPTVLENLWQQTLSAYVENPLPPLFKEKLFAYLSRYCAAPYCIVCHSCALRPLGMSAAEVLALLETPPRSDMEIIADLTLLSAEPQPLAEWPAAGSPLDQALTSCAIFMFLHPDRAERCQVEARRLLGALYTRLAELLAYVRSCHAWVEAHPELAYEADARAQANLGSLVRQEPRLSAFFRDYRARVRQERETGEARRIAELEARAAELAGTNEALRTQIRRRDERST